jgi:hypothetical protein
LTTNGDGRLETIRRISSPVREPRTPLRRTPDGWCCKRHRA